MLRRLAIAAAAAAVLAVPASAETATTLAIHFPSTIHTHKAKQLKVTGSAPRQELLDVYFNRDFKHHKKNRCRSDLNDQDIVGKSLISKDVGPGEFTEMTTVKSSKPLKGRLCAYLSHRDAADELVLDKKVSKQLTVKK